MEAQIYPSLPWRYVAPNDQALTAEVNAIDWRGMYHQSNDLMKRFSKELNAEREAHEETKRARDTHERYRDSLSAAYSVVSKDRDNAWARTFELERMIDAERKMTKALENRIKMMETRQ
jgi:tryptophan 2,3-dioxygenase